MAYKHMTEAGEIVLEALVNELGAEVTKHEIGKYQAVVDQFACSPQFTQYVDQAKLNLLDSKFAAIDLLLKMGIVTVNGRPAIACVSASVLGF